MSVEAFGEVPRSACVFVMAPATWRRLCEERGEAMDPGMEMGSILSMVMGRFARWRGDVRPRLGAVLLCADLPLALSRGTVRTGDEAAPIRFVVGGVAQLGFTTGSPAQIPRVVK